MTAPMAIISSKLLSRPMMPAAATGPGVGGMNTWDANRPAASASDNATGDWPERAASDRPTGLTNTNPLSQKTGIDTIQPISNIASLGKRRPTVRSTARAMATAAPVLSRILPIMVPKIITNPMPVKMLEKPRPTVSGRVCNGMPSANARTRAVTRIEING